MLDKSLCHLDGKKDLWNKMIIVYPVKISKELKDDELEMKAFIFWAMQAIELCFSPDSIDGFDDIDIYALSPEDLECFYEEIIQALLLMFFIDYGYHHKLASTHYRTLNNKVGDSFRDLSMYKHYEKKIKPNLIARDMCILFSSILKKSITTDEILNLFLIMDACYDKLLKYLKDDKAIRGINFEVLQFGFGLDSKIMS